MGLGHLDVSISMIITTLGDHDSPSSINFVANISQSMSVADIWASQEYSTLLDGQ